MCDMELQLRLALPNNHNPAGKGFDLNDVGFKPKQGLGLKSWKDTKRSFEDAFGKIGDESPVMPLLLLWSGQPNEEDDQNGQEKRNCSTINKNEEEEKLVVGWPPVQTWRKKLLHQGQVGRIENNNRMANQKKNNNGGPSNSKFVKVKMEGVAIARKVDLRLYHSFGTLTTSLIDMFAKYQKCEKPGVRYTLIYQDKGGDWLLPGDVQWLTFMESAKRLEILRSGSEESG